jgi:TctA family transporter
VEAALTTLFTQGILSAPTAVILSAFYQHGLTRARLMAMTGVFSLILIFLLVPSLPPISWAAGKQRQAAELRCPLVHPGVHAILCVMEAYSLQTTFTMCCYDHIRLIGYVMESAGFPSRPASCDDLGSRWKQHSAGADPHGGVGQALLSIVTRPYDRHSLRSSFPSRSGV